MRNAKNINLGKYKNIRMSYGTIDYTNLKSLFLEFKTWVKPKNTFNYNHLQTKCKRKMNYLINQYNNTKFKKECIVDVDLSTDYMTKNKRSFMYVDLTLFVNHNFDIKDKNTKIEIKQLMQQLIDESFDHTSCIYNPTKY